MPLVAEMQSSLRGAGSAAKIAGRWQQIRQSHVGSAALFVSPSTRLTTLPFAPVSNPSRRQPNTLQKVKSLQVQGPLGTVLVPLADFVQINWEEEQKDAANEPRKLSLAVQDSTIKTQRSVWGLTRALLANAIEGVEEGHALLLRLVGVGYRAALETDPFPRPDKFDVALSSTPSNFQTAEQQSYYANVIQEAADKPENKIKQRLSLRLGYSHPIYMPIPRGITCTTPAPTRIIVKGTNKEQVGLFASQIRNWRKPEPYKGKGVFVGDETIRLKTAKKK